MNEEETSGDLTRNSTNVTVALIGRPAPWSLGIVNRDGAILLHRHRPAGPDPCLKALTPSREELVVGVEGLFTWDWLADRWARDAMPVGLGQALSMKASHGGKATHDTMDAPTMAVLRRGGLLPPADVDPAAMRAPRDLLRRRIHLRRNRAALLAPVQQTHSPDNLPALGQKMADNAHRDGVAERCPAPAVHKRSAVDLALLGHDDDRLRDVAWSSLKAAQPDDAHTRDWRRTVPGIGELRSLVLLSAIQDIPRFPRVQACVSSGRVVTCAKASAGKR